MRAHPQSQGWLAIRSSVAQASIDPPRARETSFSGAAEPPLAELLARLSPADLTLIEGYRWEPLPKLEVYRPELGKPALYPDDRHIVAVAANVPAPAGLAPGVDWLDLGQPAAVLAWLLRRIGRGGEGGAGGMPASSLQDACR